MTDSRVNQALARIAAAATRIEAAAARPQPALNGGDAALEARHERLRKAVSQSLQQLDLLIDGAGQ